MLEVECEDVRVVLDKTPIVHGVSLRAEAGAWTSVIGPNGAGKTTFLHAVAGLIAYQGEVRLNGRSLRDFSRRERARVVGLAPQTPIIPPGMTVTDYVILGRTAHLSAFGSPGGKDRSIVASLIEELDLVHLATRTVASLSGGERQRCLLARILAQQAPVMLLDEPTTGLDLSHAQQVLDLIAKTHERLGITVISTMHDLTLAGSYASHLALIADGRVVAAGSPGQVLREPVLNRHYGGRIRVIDHEGTIVVMPGKRA